MEFLLLIFVLPAMIFAERDVPGRTALDDYPLIDGHNDLPFNIYNKLNNVIYNFSFEKDLSQDHIFGLENCDTCHTDLARIKKGKLGAQFWSAYVECNKHQNTTVSRSFEQVDLIKRLIKMYPHDMEFVTTADGIVDAFLHKRLASLIGLEGGHSIDNKLALLREFYDLGVRYMTLTHICNLPWADSSASESPHVNLTEFGKRVVVEMNRLGMMVDLSHVSHEVMSQAIDTSKAPVIFSHSASYAVYPHHRNVRDDILKKLKQNDGIIMVNFYSRFIGEDYVTMKDVAKHINHIVDVIGVDHVGIGGDYDGVDSFPVGLEDVSKYPDLFDFLKEKNSTRWTIDNLQKLAGKNLHRVFKSVEQVKEKMASEKPDETLIDISDAPETRKLSYLAISFCLIFVYTS